MSIFLPVLEWTKNTFEPLGAGGLFILAFMESSFFPIPPDILLIVLCLAKPEFALIYALVCTLGSTIGGMFGYLIGYVGEVAVLERLFSKSKIAKVHNLFQRYEVWAIGIAGFTPIPYKVFTIAAGVFYLDFKKFIIVSFFSRGARFFLEAILIIWFGAVVVGLINKYFNIVTLVGAVLLLAGYIIYRRIKKMRK